MTSYCNIYKRLFSKYFLCLPIVLLLAVHGQAQQAKQVTIASAGSSAVVNGYTIESTVGETVIATAGTGPICTQGLHQPNVVQVDLGAGNGFALVYPNPVQTTLYIKLYLEETTSVLLTLYTATGQQVLARFREVMPGYHNESIPVTGLKPGIYMLIVRDTVTGRKLTVKVLKQ